MALNYCKNASQLVGQFSKFRTTKSPVRTLTSSESLRANYYEEQKTTVTVLNQQEGASLMIDSYSQIGFRLNNGIFVMGPMAIFPKSVFSWNVANAASVNQESLSLFCTLAPKIDILVLGVGDRGEKVNPAIIHYMRSMKINLEILPTEKACATFNFLNSEHRYVAAALIPPMTIRAPEHYIDLDKLKAKNLSIYGE